MTANPVCVAEDAGYKQIVDTLARYGISAVPVVDAAGVPVGVVSEADLLTRLDHRRRRRRHARLGKTGALLARDLMTSPAATIGADTSVTAATVRLADAGIRRLFVVEAGKLVGVVARRDLLAVFRRPDDEIRTAVEHDILADTLRVPPGQASVTVSDGVVTLLGRLDSRGAVERAGELSADIAGVLAVKNRLDFVWDDRRTRTSSLQRGQR
ncbi:CBS domain-containing protein [Amycolatopsis oliviviridis]|nr:CBS domain-containing protein [Amycolatopsis oliviviridis]